MPEDGTSVPAVPAAASSVAAQLASIARASALGLLAFLLWRRRDMDLMAASLLAAALAFTASFFVVSIACDYRYLYFLDLAAMAGALAATTRKA